ncbi:VID27 cytoplasmic protein [Laetiporus sulphureus 93-53]|uniref:VID27 cytoplasmic protein n=1 Tax=Laetiporus sulphureus 93-53 TaxID=1314785 RepID=A0A165I1K2_9APHY|nr:VID27 cytoplasmic protein [Laetiporus sulphureus 93-53]KZT12472.1 VID27 cytoplasmic protein [Laetiporus sulphureus 93-53]
MNIFRSLLGKVWHDPNAAEVVKISEGQLYLVRSGTIRGARECIYNDAMATIRRVPSLEHNFQLVITRVFEEGDQELLEDEDETDEERVFLISEELEFRSSTGEDGPSFIWRDLEGDIDESYEFVASGTNEPTRAFFETCMYRAMYERKYKKSADDTTDADLAEFIYKPPATKTKAKSTTQKKATAVSTASGEATVSTTDISVTQAVQDTSAMSPASSPPTVVQPPASTPKLDTGLPTLISERAELHLWDREHGYFVKQADVTAQIVQNPAAGPFAYWVVAASEQGQLLAHQISSDMNHRWSSKVQSITWNHISDDGLQSSWCLRFESEEAFENFQKAFTVALWEFLNQYSWEKAKSDEQAYVMSSNLEDVEMRDVEDEEGEEHDVEAELDQSEDESEPEPEPEGDEEAPPPLARGERNSQLTVGYKGDRSYVVRGNKIGVFSHANDNQVKYHATISNLSTGKVKEFQPKHVMLHDQDTKMILMNPQEPNSLFSLDIERGKIVEEWKVHEDVRVNHIAPDSKFAQMTPEQTIVGASHNALFRIDPRMSGNKMVDSQFKQYVSKNQFSGVATTDSGKLAVASEKGDIRLFDSIGKNAKTALPPLGDPITGIDVTASGRWIVATTKTYLLLIDTLIGEGRYTGSLGFDRSFPANAKPIPRRLQLRAEHVAYMDHSISFTPARFNMGEGQEENAIVTSTGQYVIAWDFAKVKRGQLDKYEIKKYEDYVVQDNFKFGDDKEIIVALQNNVLAVNKKSLKRPTRASIGTPSRELRSRSSIVHAPY